MNSLLEARVNADESMRGLPMGHLALDNPSAVPVLATPAAVTAAAAWVTANKAAVGGAAAFGALFGAGVWVGVANAN